MNNQKVAYGLNLFSAILTLAQTEHIFQIVQLILTIVAVIVSTAFTIYKWYKSAMKDGKITDEELEDLQEKLNIKGKKK